MIQLTPNELRRDLRQHRVLLLIWLIGVGGATAISFALAADCFAIDPQVILFVSMGWMAVYLLTLALVVTLAHTNSPLSIAKYAYCLPVPLSSWFFSRFLWAICLASAFLPLRLALCHLLGQPAMVPSAWLSGLTSVAGVMALMGILQYCKTTAGAWGSGTFYTAVGIFCYAPLADRYAAHEVAQPLQLRILVLLTLCAVPGWALCKIAYSASMRKGVVAASSLGLVILAYQVWLYKSIPLATAPPATDYDLQLSPWVEGHDSHSGDQSWTLRLLTDMLPPTIGTHMTASPSTLHTASKATVALSPENNAYSRRDPDALAILSLLPPGLKLQGHITRTDSGRTCKVAGSMDALLPHRFAISHIEVEATVDLASYTLLADLATTEHRVVDRGGLRLIVSPYAGTLAATIIAIDTPLNDHALATWHVVTYNVHEGWAAISPDPPLPGGPAIFWPYGLHAKHFRFASAHLDPNLRVALVQRKAIGRQHVQGSTRPFTMAMSVLSTPNTDHTPDLENVRAFRALPAPDDSRQGRIDFLLQVATLASRSNGSNGSTPMDTALQRAAEIDMELLFEAIAQSTDARQVRKLLRGITQAAGPQHRDLLLHHLRYYPDLARVALDQGWKPTTDDLANLLNSTHDTSAIIKGLLIASTPEADAILLDWAAAHPGASGWDDLMRQPRLRPALEPILRRYVARNGGDIQWLSGSATAAGYLAELGDHAAFALFIQQCRRELIGSSDRQRQARRLILAPQSPEELKAFATSIDPNQWSWDPHTRMFTPQQEGKP